jgi:dihydrofolate reductase
MRVSLIVAAAENDVIGRDGDLPWHLPDDLRHFRALTAGHVVVAGRRTHEGILARLGRPLPDRLTVVVTSSGPVVSDGAFAQPSVPAALAAARAAEAFAGRDEVFVIGGAGVYAAALPAVDRIHLTRVRGDVEGDVRMPAGWLDGFVLVGETPAAGYAHLTYERGR